MCDGGCNHCRALSSASVRLGAGVSTSKGARAYIDNCNSCPFQYGNLGPHGQ
jgi:hypothetical protein